MLSPGVAYSREMTWDFFYNLEGGGYTTDKFCMPISTTLSVRCPLL
jgi:hypothetical protein